MSANVYNTRIVEQVWAKREIAEQSISQLLQERLNVPHDVENGPGKGNGPQ